MSLPSWSASDLRLEEMLNAPTPYGIETKNLLYKMVRALFAGTSIGSLSLAKWYTAHAVRTNVSLIQLRSWLCTARQTALWRSWTLLTSFHGQREFVHILVSWWIIGSCRSIHAHDKHDIARSSFATGKLEQQVRAAKIRHVLKGNKAFKFAWNAYFVINIRQWSRP